MENQNNVLKVNKDNIDVIIYDYAQTLEQLVEIKKDMIDDDINIEIITPLPPDLH
mgnify:CR=1 FL=1